MRIAIHQANFIPWFPFFEKMYQADIFVVMVHCQFTKNGFTNRAMVNGKWWTNPVEHGMKPILDKKYVGGHSLANLNLQWIRVIAETLGIDTDKIKLDFCTEAKGTDRIIEICNRYGCDEYLTNPSASEKYLDAKKLEEVGINVIPFTSKHKKHVFELFDEIGVEKTRNLLDE